MSLVRSAIIGTIAAALCAALGAPVAQAAFPGADGLIVFDRYPRTSTPYEEVYVVKPSGGGLTRLTDRAGARVSSVYPDWNAAGNRIAFQRGTATSNQVVIMKPNGTVVSNFGDRTCAGGIGMPSWSPNGTTIAYVCFDTDWMVKTFDLVTRDRHTLASTGYNTEPEFSPDGTAIAYSAERDGGARYEVVAAYLDGSGDLDHSTTMAGDLTESALDPDWSPDGTDIAYSCATVLPTFGDQDICTVAVAAPGTGSAVITGGNQDQFPAYSPSGNELVWDVGPEESDTELKRRSVGGGSTFTITSNRVVDQQADWGPR